MQGKHVTLHVSTHGSIEQLNFSLLSADITDITDDFEIITPPYCLKSCISQLQTPCHARKILTTPRENRKYPKRFNLKAEVNCLRNNALSDRLWLVL